MEGFSPFGNVAVILSFLICLALLVAKTRLIHRILKAKTDVNVFNHSIALCFAMSGETFNQFGIQTGGFTLKHHMHKKAEYSTRCFPGIGGLVCIPTTIWLMSAPGGEAFNKTGDPPANTDRLLPCWILFLVRSQKILSFISDY